MVQLKSEGGSSPLIQRIIYEFASLPAFPAHIEAVQATYRERRYAIIAAVAHDLPEARIAALEAGYYVLLTLQLHIDGDMLVTKTEKVSVHRTAGISFF